MNFSFPAESVPQLTRCRSMRLERKVFEGNSYTLHNSDSFHVIDYHARILHGNVERTLKPGDWIHTPRGIRFQYLELESGSHQYYHYINPTKHGMVCHIPTYGNFGADFQRYWEAGEIITQDFNRRSEDHDVLANHGLFVLLNRLHAEYSKEANTNQSLRKRSDYIIDSIASELNRNLQDVVDVNQICEKYEISPAYLNKRFRAKFGCSVTHYHMNKRLHYACELISETTLPFTAIAEETGFYDYHHFNKKMRQHLGMNPTKYREQSFVKER